jgi:hypothetical protein
MITSNSRVINLFTGDFGMQSIAAAGENSNSPGAIIDYALTTGNNTITPPAQSTGATLLFPTANTVLVTLKGVAGDTGIVLHPTDPTRIAINSTSAFVLSVASAVSMKIIWS